MIDQGNGAAAGSPDLIKDTTTQTFVKDVIEESRNQPVLIDFWAPWCGPCKQLTPILEKAVRAAKGRVKLVKMNIDEHPAIPGQMGIQSIPAVIAFVNGQPADGFMGAVPESQINAFIDKLTQGMPPMDGSADLLGEAEAALNEGDAATAASLYAQALSEDASSIPAIAGLARCYVGAGALDQAKQTLGMVPESKRNDPAISAVQTMLDLAEQAAGDRIGAVLPQRLETESDRGADAADLAGLRRARQQRRRGGDAEHRVGAAVRGEADDHAA